MYLMQWSTRRTIRVPDREYPIEKWVRTKVHASMNARNTVCGREHGTELSLSRFADGDIYWQKAITCRLCADRLCRIGIWLLDTVPDENGIRTVPRPVINSETARKFYSVYPMSGQGELF